MKALFASDIDNTLADATCTIPKKVQAYLETLHGEGWGVMFLTGRSFTFAQKALAPFKIPYYLAVQNGAEVLSMPDKFMISRHFLNREVLNPISEIFEKQGVEFFIYSGFHEGDFCYYRPHHISPDYMEYLIKLQALTKAPWVEVNSWDEAPESFPLIKCIAHRKTLIPIRDALLKLEYLSVVVMNDVVDPEKSTLMISHQDAIKGKALQTVYQRQHLTCPIIAAGDSNNDFCLLENGDIAIAMEDSPLALKELADIISKSATESGIIEALQKARKMIEFP